MSYPPPPSLHHQISTNMKCKTKHEQRIKHRLKYLSDVIGISVRKIISLLIVCIRITVDVHFTRIIPDLKCLTKNIPTSSSAINRN
ncbi:hypothetical protein DERP_006990 [Dermatophagoides pteronyssinus]|uniref:Uncharacterized protein n=1 Tax=Dermatophagoides pteronyssinus TaxID=6956 RepID=A0ABQ8JTU4_DERPT|nr:hypothetical protein DERP_006990 [Dermatophagoides pteronyssinus]